MVPTVESKFLTKGQGLLLVIERVGELNYKVYQQEKRKLEQIYYINLFKPWKDRVTLTADFAPVTLGITESPLVLKVTITDMLSSSPKQ